MPQSIYQGTTYIGETIQATIGNLLTANQASVETDTTGLTAFNGTIARVAGSAVHGAAFLRVTATAINAGGGTSGATAPAFWGGAAYAAPVTPGVTYTARASVKSDTGVTGNARIVVYYFTAAGATVSTDTGSFLGPVTSSWGVLSREFVPPATAAYAQILVQVWGALTSEQFDLDALGIWAGAGGDWEMPGIPILGIGSPTWEKAPVWNWVEGNWIQLNADIGPVDFALRNLSNDRVLLDIDDHKNYDYLDYSLTVTGLGVSGTPINLPDDTDTTWITGLTPNSTYTVLLVANLLSGGQTPDSIQTFKTPVNPIPDVVIDLTSTARTNSWIDLKWSSPAGTTATSYRVYYGKENGPVVGTVEAGGTTARVVSLSPDTKYWYYVRGINTSGTEGPPSNQIRWATGHGEIRRQGSDTSIMWTPGEWGSFRNDIQWRWSREGYILARNPHLYQGYWPGNNWHGASNPAQNVAAGDTRRYWGVIKYSDNEIRAALDRKHGSGVGSSITISNMAFRSLYRHTNPGSVAAQDMVWHLTQSNPFNSAKPPVYRKYDAKSMRAGEKAHSYKLPGNWGTKLIRGLDGGTKVNGLVLYRKDNQTNGYGAAGYGRWSGHLLTDSNTSGSWRKSDLTLMMSGSWDQIIRAYKSPYQW